MWHLKFFLFLLILAVCYYSCGAGMPIHPAANGLIGVLLALKFILWIRKSMYQ